jgi:hypothetical protein
MPRIWKDQRGREWEVEAAPSVDKKKPSDKERMIHELPWRVWFRSGDTTRSLRVNYDVVTGLDRFSERELEDLFNLAEQNIGD